MASLHLNDIKQISDIELTDAAGSSSPGDAEVFDDSTGHVPEKYRGTSADQRDMNIMGKKQVLRRNFNFITMLGFASTCVASWEGILTYLGFVLTDGGTPLLFWGFIACAAGQTLVYATGGQYHWVSEFAPRRMQKILSYFSGWLTAIGWQVYLASVCFLVGTIIQGLIVLNDSSYVYQRWHGTLLSISIVVFCIIFNTALASRLPIIEGMILILHLLGFLAIIVPLWVMAPRGSGHVVLLEFTNYGGWTSTGLSAMIGLLAPMAVLVGYDCSVHMSEEIKDASVTLPRAIMGSVVVNITLVFIVIITICFTLGDAASVLASPTGYPFIQLFYNATQSYAGTNVMTAIIIVMLSACAVSEVAAASRQVWSFARDAGLPGHSWLSKVSPGWNVPVPAVAVSLTISVLLSLINIGSTVALNAITSLGAIAVLISYFLTISCVVYRRLQGPKLPVRRWSLGRWGLAINCAALAFLVPLIFFLTWPLVTPVTATTMNWSSVMMCGTLILAAIYYVFKGRKEYVPPVVHVKRQE
ncbi:uncharacterized protein Z519_10787 [Cladophialophora bantiana CBS 173.52]|uniref:Amino acid permease n=1 Tax=Cladophialophora bantiana (strain ATCC 10958 / CBS 173.52 / CDC B-1940 / NIH 8579) TaxID=1442370 RepID=A0A0D2EF78_CLAB1|nr:uncharacterized protein Z519_10787 [Cladophialophora bantiana CBS 173.52]KIW88741.1 hypothetical protein Z519_10787 [Cladophialophora bantiana CBS 173.52]